MSLAAPTTVNCTSCGAGLDVLGGGRVMVHICPYCGSELDAQDNYKVLAQFEGMRRPDSPFRIGMRGTIRGADYTVIGTIEFTETYRGRTWTWIDHQLYSATHGYAWLTLEDGHPVFTRRFRRPAWMSVGQVERADTPPRVRVDGESFRYYETSTGRITFAEGEFTWAPRVGDTTTTVTVLSDRAMLGFSQTGEEREVYRSELLDSAEIGRAFGIDRMPEPQGTHPLQPYTGGENDRFMRNTALVAMAACFVLAMVFDGRTGREVADPIEVPAASLPANVPLTIPEMPGPVRITLDGTPHVAPLPSAPLSPLWARVGVTLTDPTGAPVLGAPTGGRVYVGGQAEGQGPGPTNHAELVFPSSFSGDYRLQLIVTQQGPTGTAGTQQPGATVGQRVSSAIDQIGAVSREMLDRISGSGSPFSDGSITIRTYAGMSNGYWLYRLGFVFLAVTIFTLFRRMRFNARRWKGSDWTSED